jgi:hypothetical protein
MTWSTTNIRSDRDRRANETRQEDDRRPAPTATANPRRVRKLGPKRQIVLFAGTIAFVNPTCSVAPGKRETRSSPSASDRSEGRSDGLGIGRPVGGFPRRPRRHVGGRRLKRQGEGPSPSAPSLPRGTRECSSSRVTVGGASRRAGRFYVISKRKVDAGVERHRTFKPNITLALLQRGALSSASRRNLRK